jgi:predicted 3-demethylubiquinone-9 3-methyltransferase (glyoxalase superfamily)
MAISGVTTYLWFDEEALEAAQFYASTFPETTLGNVSYYQEGAPKPAGTALTVELSLFGQPFVCLNGGPEFPHTPATSFQIYCDTQDEIDRLWNALIANGGEEGRCGWCKDRFGVSWQIVPSMLGDLLGGGDAESSQYAFGAMMQMSKMIIADFRRPA